MRDIIISILHLILLFITLFLLRYAVVELIDLYNGVLIGKIKKLESENTNEK